MSLLAAVSFSFSQIPSTLFGTSSTETFSVCSDTFSAFPATSFFETFSVCSGTFSVLSGTSFSSTKASSVFADVSFVLFWSRCSGCMGISSQTVKNRRPSPLSIWIPAKSSKRKLLFPIGVSARYAHSSDISFSVRIIPIGIWIKSSFPLTKPYTCKGGSGITPVVSRNKIRHIPFLSSTFAKPALLCFFPSMYS